MFKSKKMKSIIRSTKIQFFLFGVVTALAVIFATMQIINYEQNQRNPKGVYVSIGAMEYDFSNGKAVKRDDEVVKDLRQFLTNLGKKSVSDNCPSVHHNVVLVNEDESQVLLEYGCDYPSARMFAVKENSGWRTISPTNRFDMLGIPECSHVDDNTISKSIAPVCVNETLGDGNDEPAYKVR